MFFWSCQAACSRVRHLTGPLKFCKVQYAMPIWLTYCGETLCDSKPALLCSWCIKWRGSVYLLQLLQQRTLYVQKHILPDLPNPVFDRVTRLCTATDCDPISISTARFDPTCYADRVLTLIVEER